MIVRPLMDHVPQSPLRLAELRERLYANPLYVNSIISPDGKAAFVLADFRLGERQRGYRSLLEQVQNLLPPNDPNGLRFYLGGLASNLAWLEIYSQRMQYLFLVVIAIVMGVSYLSFGTLQGMLVPMLTAFTSVIWTLGIMGWLSIPMDTYNVATPILVMTVAHGHSVQILKRYYEEYRVSHDTKLAVIEALARVGPVMVTAGGIAIVSFLTLLTFPVRTIQVFGEMASLGIVSAMILEMTLIPAVRMVLPPPKHQETERERRGVGFNVILRSINHGIKQQSGGPILLLTLVLVLVLGIGVTFLRIDNSLKGNFSASSQVRQDDTFLNEHSGGTNTLYLLFKGDHPDTLKEPAVLQAMDDIQNYLRVTFDRVGKTQSIADLLKQINKAMHGDAEEYYRLPESQDLIAQYLLLYSFSGDPSDFDVYVDNDYRSAVLWVFLKIDSTAYIETVIHSVEGLSARLLPPYVKLKIGGSVAETVALNDVMVRGKLLNVGIIAVSIFALSALVFRSALAAVFVLVPLVLTVLANFGVMGLLGIRLDVATAAISALAVGVGADYAIYLIWRLQEELKGSDWDAAIERTLNSAGKAIISVGLAVGAGYAVLMFSGFNAHMRLGALVALSMAVSSIAAVCVLPTLLYIMRPTFLQDKRLKLDP